MKHQDYGTLKTIDGKDVYSRHPEKSPQYTLNKEEAWPPGSGPVIGLREYGARNNRATKAHAEKELGLALAWGDSPTGSPLPDPSILTENYHGKYELFILASKVNYVSDGGKILSAVIVEFDNEGGFRLEFEDGAKEWVTPKECFLV